VQQLADGITDVTVDVGRRLLNHGRPQRHVGLVIFVVHDCGVSVIRVQQRPVHRHAGRH
jgi:hypothetical protein